MSTDQQNLRHDLLELSALHKAHHLGSCLSCIDILWALYNHLNLEEDKFILSKGHAALALYIVLARKKIIDKSELFATYAKQGSRFLAHPSSRHLPCVAWSTGALGQGLGVAAGMALSLKHEKSSGKVFVMISGGELNCGATWEAIACASALKLDNLILLIDHNKIQGIDFEKSVLNIDHQLELKFKSFSWDFKRAPGHDLAFISDLLSHSQTNQERPLALCFDTVKGKGIPSIENTISSHYQFATKDLIQEFNEQYA